ncbi:type 1 glutamine amidotransferase [Haloglomus litoreum]|uniref:type 1 glutamine amidotransferase n=1 Tax=Haloglomus litoreum TaxID=3034026 RepID=UPI0023E8A42B|nr:type 1 glutamine amidotransferase [Haloglomus sp. DT116]
MSNDADDRLRLALLNASTSERATSQNFRRELDADLAEFQVNDGQFPRGYDFDGFVVTGSAVSVYWDSEQEWVEPISEWIREAVDRGLPALGICFGHQLLAHALGGRVEDMGEYELGYREVRRTDRDGPDDDGDPLFAGLDEAFLVFTTHSDTVAEVPPGAEVIAENDYGNHGFRLGRVAGVQAHPEYDQAMAEAVTLTKDLPEERIQRVLDGITDENYARASETKRLFDNFTDYARRVRAERVAAD